MATLGVMGASNGAAVGGGNAWLPSSSSSSSSATGASTRLCLRAQKKQSSSSSNGSGGRKTLVAEKSLPGGGGKGGSQLSKKRSGSTTSSAIEVEMDRMAALPGPSPPAGFVLDDEGDVVLVAPANNRIVTIMDPATQRPLECMIRRAFQSSDGLECLLLLPLDMPIQILKIEIESEGLTELSDAELQRILPSAVYALAKRRLHLIASGFCLTARGGFCYTEEHILDFESEYGEGLGGSLTEGVEIASFVVNDSEYIVYTPFDPVMFVAYKDDLTGMLTIAEDDLLDDEVVVEAIDEENEFQALVDEEDAMHDTLKEAK